MKTLMKLTWIEAKLFLRDPITVVFTFLLPLIFLFVLAEVFTRAQSGGLYRGADPIDFYAAAYIGTVISAVGLISLPVHLAGYRAAGVLRRFHASAVSKWHVFGSQVIISLAIIIISSAILVAATAWFYGLNTPAAPVQVIGAVLLGGLTLTVFGFFLGTILPSARSAQLAGLILFFAMLLLSGAGPPPELMGDKLNSFANLLPLTHIVRLIQDPWLGFGWNGAALIRVLGILLTSSLLTIVSFRRYS